MSHTIKRRLPIFSTFIKTLLDDTTATAALGTLGITTGVYLPTLSAITNVAATTAYDAQYVRVGNVVTVALKFDCDPTAAAPTVTVVGITLPIASNFTADDEGMGGGGARVGGTDQVSVAFSSDATNVMRALWSATNTGNQGCYGSFTYLVL